MTLPRAARRPLRARSLALTPVLALALVLTLTACGGDDEPSSSSTAANDSSGSPDVESGDVDSTGVVGELEEGGLEGVGEALDAVNNDFLFETAIDQISGSLNSSSGFELDGYTATISFDKTQAEGGSDCIIGTSVLDAFEFDEEPTLVMRYTDGEVTC
ncbi:MAG: hypothetical protein WB767_13960 [Nocardioides sp.]